MHRWLSSNKASSQAKKMCVNVKYHANRAQVCGHVCSFIYTDRAERDMLMDQINPQETFVTKYICMCICMCDVCVYVCMYTCMCIYVYIHNDTTRYFQTTRHGCLNLEFVATNKNLDFVSQLDLTYHYSIYL